MVIQHEFISMIKCKISVNLDDIIISKTIFQDCEKDDYMSDLKLVEYLEIFESLLEMTARKEAEIAELKAELDVFKPKDIELEVLGENRVAMGKVLLIFKSKTLREILKSMLEKNAVYDVKVVEPYDDVQSAYALYNPDICIIEHETHNESDHSVEIIAQLRKLSGKLGLIAVLAENDVETIRDIVTAGVDDFLVKPIDTRRMNKVIADIVLRRRARKIS